MQVSLTLSHIKQNSNIWKNYENASSRSSIKFSQSSNIGNRYISFHIHIYTLYDVLNIQKISRNRRCRVCFFVEFSCAVNVYSLPCSIRQPDVCIKSERIYRERFVRVYVWATPAHRASDRNFNVMWSDFRRHGSQCACYYGPRRTKKADREHEVPSFNGALASIQKYCRVSTVPTLLFTLLPF